MADEPNPAPTPAPTSTTPAANPNPPPALTDPPAAPPANTPEPGKPAVDPAKPADPAAKPAEEFVPITAEAIKLPEGFEADAPVMDKFLGIMNDRDKTPAQQAQALVELQGEANKAAFEKASELWANQQTTWQDEVRADKEIGGTKLDGVLGGISTLLNTHGTPELRQVFAETGAGNNIHMVKFMHKIAGLLGEGQPAPGSIPADAPKSLADRIFPNMKQG